MPLAEHRGLVTRSLQEFREGLLRSIKVIPVVHKAVLVAVLAGNDDSPAGTADGIRAKTFMKNHSLRCQSIDVGGWVGAL